MCFKTLLLCSGVRTDEIAILGLTFSAPREPILPPRDLMVNVQGYSLPWGGGLQRYISVIAYPGRFVDRILDVQNPIHELTDAEADSIRDWLIQENWEAWARTATSVRAFVGCHDEPVSLVEAALQLGCSHSSLIKAAEQRRLPVIEAGDQKFVYLDTIEAAREHGLVRKKTSTE